MLQVCLDAQLYRDLEQAHDGDGDGDGRQTGTETGTGTGTKSRRPPSTSAAEAAWSRKAAQAVSLHLSLRRDLQALHIPLIGVTYPDAAVIVGRRKEDGAWALSQDAAGFCDGTAKSGRSAQFFFPAAAAL